jgi:hypothetical protein
MRRHVRAPAVAGALAGSARLAGCSKPAPSVTVENRVTASTNNGNPFIIQVAQLRTGEPDGSRWSFLVKVGNQT